MVDISDRLSILNVVASYAYLWDSYQGEAWADLFTDDAVISATSASDSDSAEVLSRSNSERRRSAERAKEARARLGQIHHQLSNPVFLSQTPDSAKIVVLGIVVRTNLEGRTAFWSPVQYAGTLRKHGDTWKIQTWHMQMSANPALNEPEESQ